MAQEDAPIRPRERRTFRAPSSIVDWVLILVALVVIALAVFAVIDLFTDDDGDFGIGVTLGEVTDDPEEFAGEHVIVSGLVERQVTPRLFALGDEELLVVSDAAIDVSEGMVVQVDGVVRRLPASELSTEFGLEVPEETASELDDDPLTLLVANSTVANPAEKPGGDDALAGVPPPESGALTVEQVFNRAEDLRGQSVTVVGDMFGTIVPGVATISGLPYGTDDILIIGQDEALGAFPQSIPVRVTGTLIEFQVDEVEQQFGIEFPDDLADGYEGLPAIVINSINFYLYGPGLAGQLADLVGRRATVVSEVEDVIADNAFEIGSGATTVFNPQGGADIVPEALVQVTGEVMLYDEELLAERLGPEVIEAIPEDVREELDGDVVIVAESVEVTR